MESEADLCSAFMTVAQAEGWVCYPEQGGWDILLVRRGLQIGVQAKLRANVKVLIQAAPGMRGHRYVSKRPEPEVGPHYRMVLVKRFSDNDRKSARIHLDEFLSLAQCLRILVGCPPSSQRGAESWLGGARPSLNLIRHRARPPYGAVIDWKWYRWHPKSLIWTPGFVPKLRAGVPSPTSVTPWLVCSLEVERICRERGWVSIDDVREVQRRIGGGFTPSSLLRRWYECTGEKVKGRTCKWVRHPRFKPCSEEYPIVARQVGL